MYCSQRYLFGGDWLMSYCIFYSLRISCNAAASRANAPFTPLIPFLLVSSPPVYKQPTKVSFAEFLFYDLSLLRNLLHKLSSLFCGFTHCDFRLKLVNSTLTLLKNYIFEWDHILRTTGRNGYILLLLSGIHDDVSFAFLVKNTQILTKRSILPNALSEIHNPSVFV